MTISALEIGGSHVSAAVILPSGAIGPVTTAAIDGSAAAGMLLDAFSAVAARVASPGATWGIAIPGPFDYEAGVGRYQGVGKFESLNGVDIAAGLRARLRPPPGRVCFVNDAVAFALGEWMSGPAQGRRRIVALTLGTGVGSAFLDNGQPVTTGPLVPPQGRADLITRQGRPLEDTFSTRAVLAAYRGRGGRPVAGVAAIARRAMTGEALAARVLTSAVRALGESLARYVDAFEADVLVVGGGMSAAWSLIEPPLRAGLAAASDLVIVRSADTEASALRGAGVAARRC